MKTYNRPLTAIGLLSCLALAAAAPAHSQVIERIDAAGLQAIAIGLGHQVTNTTMTDDGQPILTANSGRMNYLLAGTVCESGQCQGLLSEIIFNDTPVSLEVINQINQNYAAIKVVYLEGDSVVFSRYDVLNGGTTMGALSTSVSTLLEVAGAIVQSNE